MSLVESVVVGLFCLFIVFVVLAVLYGMVQLLSIVLRTVGHKSGGSIKTDVEKAPDETGAEIDLQSAGGKLELYNVDDKTAATIMAIVSHESGIQLDELNFKYIKALD